MIEIKNGNKQCPLTYIINMFDHIKENNKEKQSKTKLQLETKNQEKNCTHVSK